MIGGSTAEESATARLDLIRNVDLCPFVASQRKQYDDARTLDIVSANPEVCSLRHRFKCGIGNVRPLALVIALGASFDVVRLMYRACPQALEERLSGQRTLLHYIVSEGASSEVVSFVISKVPSILQEQDSFEGMPLHLAAMYPECRPAVLYHVLAAYPEGARSHDYRKQLPLHRACKSRASLKKCLPLIESYPEALSIRDWGGNKPLDWAEKNNHSLTDSVPEIVELLVVAEEVLTPCPDAPPEEGARERAAGALSHFRAVGWDAGVCLAFRRNPRLTSLLDLRAPVLPELLGMLGGAARRGGRRTDEDILEPMRSTARLDCFYSLVRNSPEFILA
mmetsp:Transcript_8364/g.19632  ORF Transcript_8364/g.19632 Transcript_8364/m.19632 type:complete len:337 (+) Transcript_8364:503-1513(+)